MQRDGVVYAPANPPAHLPPPRRIAYAILDEATRSKVALETDPRRITALLGEVMGPENVSLNGGTAGGVFRWDIAAAICAGGGVLGAPSKTCPLPKHTHPHLLPSSSCP
jgi:hypothetical protein